MHEGDTAKGPRKLQGWASVENCVLLTCAILLALYHYGGLLQTLANLWATS